MKNEILTHLADPGQLEKMYRSNKQHFKREFNHLYPELRGNALADFWHERLNYESDDITWGNSKDIVFVIFASILAGVIAKLPEILHVDEAFFYTRNVGFIIFPFLTSYFAWKHKLSTGKIIAITCITLIGLVFINLLPGGATSDTLLLSCIHLPLVLWSVLGFAFTGSTGTNPEKRLAFLKYNGNLLVITGLIMIAGGILTAATIGLFELIGLNIEEFYFENIVVFGLPAAPIVGSYLIQTNPQLVGRISPVIAKIFSPLVLLMLIIYLAAIIYSGKDPYNDREFLMIFNALLAGVMAIIFFSVAGTSQNIKGKIEILLLFLLSVVTIIVNGVAISAILFRIAEGGITPNRAAVLGGNILMLVNLLLVTVQLFKVLTKKAAVNIVGEAIARYLPVYCLWVMFVTFLFPFLFGFK